MCPNCTSTLLLSINWYPQICLFKFSVFVSGECFLVNCAVHCYDPLTVVHIRFFKVYEENTVTIPKLAVITFFDDWIFKISMAFFWIKIILELDDSFIPCSTENNICLCLQQLSWRRPQDVLHRAPKKIKHIQHVVGAELLGGVWSSSLLWLYSWRIWKNQVLYHNFHRFSWSCIIF